MIYEQDRGLTGLEGWIVQSNSSELIRLDADNSQPVRYTKTDLHGTFFKHRLIVSAESDPALSIYLVFHIQYLIIFLPKYVKQI